MKKLLVLLLSLGISITAMAHEGHDESPGGVKALHGGTVKTGKEVNIEYVISGNEVKVFPVAHEGEDVALDKVKLSATAKSPKGKPENVKFSQAGNAYVANVDFKGAHRVEMNLTTEVNGKKDTFKFQVEK